MAAALLTVRPQSADSADAKLATRIQRQLAADSRAVSRLNIEVDGGVVTLRGVATSFYQKQLWLHGTKSVVGDSVRINDEISVTSKWEDTDFGWRD
jgi:osmotically-inducible protein OsmY